MRDFQVTVDGINLKVREHENDGETIVFLHYGGSSLMVWGGVVPHFQKGYRLVMMDLRGHGQSDKPPTGYHIDDMARDVVGVLDHLQIERAYIVGSSLGAEVGVSVAANYPQRVKALVCEGALCNVYGPYGFEDVPEAEIQADIERKMAEHRARPEPEYPTAEELFEASKASFEELGWWNETIAAAEAYDVCQTDEGQYTYCWRKWAKEGYFEQYYPIRFEEYYRQITCPVLMMPSEEEVAHEAVSRAMKAFCKLAADCRIVKVPGAIHAYSWMLDPEGMSRPVLEFLAEVSS